MPPTMKPKETTMFLLLACSLALDSTPPCAMNCMVFQLSLSLCFFFFSLSEFLVPSVPEACLLRIQHMGKPKLSKVLIFFLLFLFLYMFIFGWSFESGKHLISFSFWLIERLGFEVPTLVQAQAIPVILSGRHVYPFFFLISLSMFPSLLFCTSCYIYIYIWVL